MIKTILAASAAFLIMCCGMSTLSNAHEGDYKHSKDPLNNLVGMRKCYGRSLHFQDTDGDLKADWCISEFYHHGQLHTMEYPTTEDGACICPSDRPADRMYVNLPDETMEDQLVQEHVFWKRFRGVEDMEFALADYQRNLIVIGLKNNVCVMFEVNDVDYFKDQDPRFEQYRQNAIRCDEVEQWIEQTLQRPRHLVENGKS